MAKITTLEQLKLLASKVKQQDDALGTRIDNVVEQVEQLVSEGGEPNVLEGVKVNGTALSIADKMVDILIAAGTENGTISVNGASVAVAGLQDLAYKSKVSESDLDEALLASIASKATDADLSALEVRVQTAEGKIQTLESAGFQTAADVAEAIAAANHLKYSVVESIPSTEEADPNTWYLVYNDESQHYDIYGLVNGSVQLIDDTTVDLTDYSTTEAMQAWVTQQITALNIDQYATDDDLNAAVTRISTLETQIGNVYTKSEADALFTDETEAANIADQRITAAQATDEEVEAALNEIFTPATGD